MQQILKRKQSITNEDWLKVWKNIEQYITVEEVQELEKRTLQEIREKTKGKKVAYAWSGGKDSIVLGHICQKAGIQNAILGICNLEYPSFMRWIEKNKPKGLEIYDTGQDMEWLKKHHFFLFPQKSSLLSRWYKIIQHKAQEEYYKKHGLDMLLLGRRKADGNYIGKDGIYTNSQNITRYSPLSDWPHEAILGYIHYYGLPLPPIYQWKDGFRQGTHPWPARISSDIPTAWREVFEIDSSIVYEAAKSMESAKVFLEGLEHEN